MIGFLGVRKVFVTAELTRKTQEFLRAMGRQGHEGLALWCGAASGDHFAVTNLLIPKQRAIRGPDGVCAIVDSAELHRINMELYESGLRLIAQVHSHPTDAYHSDTDDENALVNTVGALSLVVPDFAARDFSLGDCAIYRLESDGSWRSLSSGEVATLLEIVES